MAKLVEQTEHDDRLADAARVINAIRGLGRIASLALAEKLTYAQRAELAERYAAKDWPAAYLDSVLAVDASSANESEPDAVPVSVPDPVPVDVMDDDETIEL
jgi:hypothetical protein